MSELPEWLVPMAATLTQERFTGPAWRFERKLDGIRLIAFKRGGDVQLFSRNRLPQDLPTIAAAIALLPVSDAILDGELTWDGHRYHVFDLPWVDGRDLRVGLCGRAGRAAQHTAVVGATPDQASYACREDCQQPSRRSRLSNVMRVYAAQRGYAVGRATGG